MVIFIDTCRYHNCVSHTGDYNIVSQLQQAVLSKAASETCFQILAVDDEIVEYDEELTVVFEPTNPNDRISGNTTIIISDNDRKNANINNSNNRAFDLLYRCYSTS